MRHHQYALKKAIALLLSTMLLINLIPLTTLADVRTTISNTPEQNQAILDVLRQLNGDDLTAQAAAQELGDLGLLDESGQPVVTATIDVDGEQLTLDQVRQMVFSPDTDLDKLVSVDGTSITLGELKLMIEIEDELLRIKETYFGEVSLTPEQQASLDSLREQIESEGLPVTAQSTSGLGFPSGIDHDLYLDVTPAVEVANGSGAQSVTVTLKDAVGNQLGAFPWDYPVSISYRLVPASAKAGTNYEADLLSGTLEFGPGKPTAQQIDFTVLDDTSRWEGQKAFLIQYYNPLNIVLNGVGQRAAETVVTINGDYTWYSGSLSFLTVDELSLSGDDVTHWGLIDPFPLEIRSYYEANNSIVQDSSTAKDLFTEGIISGLKVDVGVGGYYRELTFAPSLELGLDTSSYRKYPFPESTMTGDPSLGIINGTSPQTLDYEPSMLTALQATNHAFGTIDISGYKSSPLGLASGEAIMNFSFVDTKQPEVKSVIVPSPEEAVFEHGHSIPITVEFSEPINSSQVSLLVNQNDIEKIQGEWLTPVEGVGRGVSSLTFLYPVKLGDNSLILNEVKGAVDLFNNPQVGALLNNQIILGIFEAEKLADAFTYAEVTMQDKIQGKVLLHLVADVPEWVTSEAGVNKDSTPHPYKLPSICASLDGGNTFIDLYADDGSLPTKLVGDFTSEYSITGADEEKAVEFYLDPDKIRSTGDEQLIVGPYAKFTVPPAVLLTADDLVITYPSFPEDGQVFAEDGEWIELGYQVLNQNATWQSTNDFSWESSDTDIAAIDQEGSINPTGRKSGTVTFKLTAENNPDTDDDDVFVISEPLTVERGMTPFLVIPASAGSIIIRQGNVAEVRWSSNLIERNAEKGRDTVYNIELFQADYTSGGLQWDQSAHIESFTVTTNTDNPVSSFAIPLEYLTQISEFGRYSYVAQVSSLDPQSETGELLTATAHISVLAQPAIAKLAQLPSYFITDATSSLPISWSLQHFDTVNGGEFMLTITDNADSSLLHGQADTGNNGGSYAFSIPHVDNGFKDVYTVAVQAKNSLDSAWSYDSFLLYVYSDEALQLWIDGVSPSSIHTMTNIPEISQMSSEEILALQRYIFLRNKISINHGDYPWGQISDQIEWQSSDNSVATINYRQGSLYQNIENFTYASYRPATEFILSGLKDGTTQVTATHAATGKTRTVNVRVNTLKDKLYLFQVFPRTVTTLTYTNGNGEQCSVETDDTGALALYEESGIRSDVYLKSTFGNREYWGTIYNEHLVSSEKDSTKLQLYPVNNFQLREVARVELYFKQPDGTPYQGNVILRGGAYKNGQYCPEALLNDQSGEEDQTLTLGADGRFTVMMDSYQFWTADSGEGLQPQDKLEFIFEVRFPGDTYHPRLLIVDGNMNQDEITRFGATVVRVTAAGDSERHKPFLSTQQVLYPDTRSIDVLDYTGNLGLGEKWDQLTVRNLVLWWGETDEVSQGQPKVVLQDEYGRVLPNQTNETFYYPFSTIKVTKHTFTLDRALLQSWIAAQERRGLDLTVFDANGDQYKRQTLPWHMTNMLGTEPVASSDSLTFVLDAVSNSFVANASQLGLSDDLLNKGLSFLSGRTLEHGSFSMVVRPTIDPSVFRALIMVSKGDMSEIYNDEIDDEFDYTPTSDEVKAMRKLEYVDQQRNEFQEAAEDNGKWQREKVWGISGYVEAEITYNTDRDRWEVIILNGGFNAGIGMTYSWNYNSWVGPVPVTAQLEAGGAAEVILRASTQHGPEIEREFGESMVYNFLTTLRLHAYLRAFGGVGQDYTVAALKIGMFGRVWADAQFAFLNQPHISSTATTGRRLTIDGQAGIQFVAKFTFVSYEKILASRHFDIYDGTWGDWNTIQQIWSEIGQGTGGTPLADDVRSLAAPAVVPVAERVVLEERDYLQQFDRSWVKPGRFGILAIDQSSGLQALETNSYPYTNPLLSDDGQLLVYLSDADSTDVEDTEVRWTRLSGGSYPNGSAIDPAGEGFGDSGLKFAGTQDFAAAAWVRQYASLQKEAGQEVTFGDVALMSNSTEVMVATYAGGTWTTTRLTENAAPDLAPVVATNGDRVLVAWRSVYAADSSDPLNFNTLDSILYSIYENGVWSEPATLYNGTSGAVKGLEAAMLQDGTTAVTYSIDTVGGPFAIEEGDVVSSGLEVVYAIVGTDGQVLKNVRVTSDSYLDENPQITTVKFEDGKERFVLGWYSVHDADGVRVGDIRLCAFEANGTLYGNFIDSISSVNEYANVNISSSFRFAKNAEHVTDLCILWTEAANSGSFGEGSTAADKDLLKAVKFRSDDRRIYITSALDVAEMPEYTLIDHFDAYVASDRAVKAVILGTDYDNGYEPTGLQVKYLGETSHLLVATPESNLFTATGSFANQVQVRSVALDYGAIVRGMRIPVQFTLFNAGIEPITSVTLQVGPDNVATFEGLYLLPNGSVTLTADYDIPADRVIDPDYNIIATFDQSETVSITDTLYLAIPDVGISNLENLQEQDGKRLLQVTLYNLSDVQLSGSNRTVKVGFYSDADMTNAVMDPLTVASFAELALIDADAYTKQITFDIATFMGAGKEIPEGGVRIYAKAWIEEPISGSEMGEIREYYRNNNVKSILFESLLLRNDGEAASVSLEQTNAGGVTRATVKVQNNSLVNVSSGNLIVRLLDSQGNELETLQSYDPGAANQGLIQLGAEGVATREFNFSQNGSRVNVTYSNAVITDDTNTKLATLMLSEIPFKYVAGVTEHSINVREMRNTTVSVVAEDPKATLQINGQAGGLANVRLHAGWNNITVTVTAADGQTKQDYVVMVYNYVPGSEPAIWPIIIQNPGGKVSYSTSGLVTVTPDQGYCVKDLLVNGKSVGAVTSYQVPSSTVAYRLEALFGPATGLITIKQNNGGTAVVSEDGLSVAITPDEGFRIQDVLVDGTSVGAVKSYVFTEPGQDHTVQVVFEPTGDVLAGYTDVANHWAKGVIAFSIERGLLVRTSTTTFSPNLPITRAMLVTVLMRLHGGRPEKLAQFSDVAAGAWYAHSVAWAVENGIAGSVGGNAFAPNRAATREELAQIVINYCRFAGIDLPQAEVIAFDDIDSVSSALRAAVTDMQQAGLMTGRGSNRFVPQGNLTRAEFAAVLHRLIVNILDD